MNKILRIVMILAIVVLIKTSCRKDDAGTVNDVLIISPELLVSYYGKNWNTIEAGLKNKKDYWYTTLNYPATLAAISLPAKDPQAPALNYKLLFNIDQQNIITKVHLETTDTVDIITGNKLMLYYYDKVFSPMPGVTYKWASDNNPQLPPITVNDLLVKLNNFNCPEPYLSFRNAQMVMSAGYWANSRAFSFDL